MFWYIQLMFSTTFLVFRLVFNAKFVCTKQFVFTTKRTNGDMNTVQTLANYLLQMNERETSIDALKTYYEKQIADKSYLINELLKKVKDLTLELAEYKQPK